MPRAKTARIQNPTENGNGVSLSPAREVGAKKNPLIPASLEEEIRRRAYELYVARGCTPGHEGEDWRQAEQEIVARYQSLGT